MMLSSPALLRSSTKKHVGPSTGPNPGRERDNRSRQSILRGIDGWPRGPARPTKTSTH